MVLPLQRAGPRVSGNLHLPHEGIFSYSGYDKRSIPPLAIGTVCLGRSMSGLERDNEIARKKRP